MANMKGITPIIAILVLLLITVSIAGASWAYISGYFGTIVSTGVEVMSIDCTASGVTMYIKNIGTDNLYTADDLVVVRETVTGDCVQTANITYTETELGAGDSGTIVDHGCNASVKAVPRYRIISGGRVQTIQTNC